MREEPGEESLAGLWSFALQALVSRAAHEINNALNGAVVNVEVVRARARPGGDAGAVADFAAAAAEQLELTTTLVAALLALDRPPRGADVATIARDAATLLAPTVTRSGVRLDAPSAGAVPVGCEPLAARLAVVGALVAVVDAASSPVPKAESAGTESALEPVRVVRCTIRSDDRPTLAIAPRYGVMLPPAVARALVRAGIGVAYEVDALTLAFPPTGAT